MSFANQIKTVLLLGGLTGLMLGAGYLLGGPRGLTIGLAIALVFNLGSYWFSHKIVLKMYKAKEVSANDNPRLHKIVREVSQLAKIPMPKVFIIPSASPNAFATGRNPKNAVLACTYGILNLLSDRELKGVIAHEMAHIKHRDILIQTIATTIAAVISYVAMMARWGAILGGFGGGRDRGGSLIEILFLATLTPIIALILQLAISRSREFLADESAAKTLHDASGLAGALEKLESGIVQEPMRFGNKTTSSLFIANPFSSRGMWGLFSTHPPINKRISALKSMRV